MMHGGTSQTGDGRQTDCQRTASAGRRGPKPRYLIGCGLAPGIEALRARTRRRAEPEYARRWFIRGCVRVHGFLLARSAWRYPLKTLIM
jgi:hypothetical protein